MNHSIEIALGKSNIDATKQYLPGIDIYKQTLSLPCCEILNACLKPEEWLVNGIFCLSCKYKQKVCFYGSRLNVHLGELYSFPLCC